ncbi:hypothetical protein H4219_005227 [Mycoemilia scoparia]|uniref:Uncharacterized protein n=1 Tax=Mycoemilia scoparia TaxID=417184 RepID=A0A9W7ZVH2_9FUNG|nr:hypothetical protein H4219_005227 [Mycoemilia scoparia]
MVPHTNLTVNTFDNNGGGGCSKKDSGNNQAFEYASVFAMNQEPESPNSYDGDDDNDVVATANSGKSKSNSLLRARVVSRKEIQSESDEFKRPVVLRVVRARNTANKKLSQVGFRCKDSSFRYCSACWKPGVIDQDPEVSGAASECSCSHAEGANEDEDISKMAQPEEDEEEKGMEQRGHMLSQQRQQQVQIPHGGTYYPEDEHMVNQEHYSAICTYGDSANAYYDHEDSNYHGQYELEFEDQQGILYHEEEVSEGKEPHSMYTGYTYEEAQGSPQDTETHGYPTQSYYESTAGLGASHTFSSRWKPYYKYPHETERPHRHYSYRPRRVAPTSPPPGRYHGYNGGERLQINPETGGGPVIMGLRDMCVYDPGLFLTRLKSYRHQLSRYQSLFDRKFGSRSGQSNDYSHHYDGTRLDLDSETAAQHQPPDDDHEGVMREQISRLHAIVCKYNTVLYEHRLKQQRAREMRYYQYYSRNVQYRGPQRYHHSDYYHSGQDYEAKETQKERQYYDYCY